MATWNQLLASTQKRQTPEEELLAQITGAQQYNPGLNKEPSPVAAMNLESRPSTQAVIPPPQQINRWAGLSQAESPEERAMREEQAKAIASEREGIDKLEMQKLMLENKVGRPDLAPVVGLMDWLSGGQSQAAKMYQRPPSPEEIEKMKFDLENAIQGRKGALSKDIAANIRNKQQTDLSKEMLKQSRFEESQTAKLEDRLYKDLDKSFIKPALEKGQMFDQIEGQLRTGNYQDVAQIMSTLARNIGSEKGALSEGDVGRQVAKTLNSEVARLENFITGKAKADPAQIEQIIKTVNVARKATLDSYDSALKSKKRNYQAMESYKPIFQPGRYGEVGFDEASSAIQTFAPKEQSAQQPQASTGRTVVKKGYNPTLNKTQLIYSDGTKEIVDGKQ